MPTQALGSTCRTTVARLLLSGGLRVPRLPAYRPRYGKERRQNAAPQTYEFFRMYQNFLGLVPQSSSAINMKGDGNRSTGNRQRKILPGMFGFVALVISIPSV